MLLTHLSLKKRPKNRVLYLKMTKILKFQLSITIIDYTVQKSLPNKEVF